MTVSNMLQIILLISRKTLQLQSDYILLQLHLVSQIRCKTLVTH